MTAFVEVALGARSYRISIGPKLLDDRASYAAFRGRPGHIITDTNVAPLYLSRLRAVLDLSPGDVSVVAAGEDQKQLGTVEQLLDTLMAVPLSRDGLLIALGGGVIGDLAGFVAAIYQRGIDFVQIPTTLLAQVDSSVGGKTGVNHRLGKNMIGAFHQPVAVLADTDTLVSLPPREFAAGMAEVVKYGMLGDAPFFAWLETNLDEVRAQEPEALAYLVQHCCAMKAEVVARDEREAGQRALLNLGHTFGHAIETWAGYGNWLHGEAVAVGMCMAADMSARMGWMDAGSVERVVELLRRLELPTRPPGGMQPDDFRTLMARDKKVVAGRLRLILLRALGHAIISTDFDTAALDATFAHGCATGADAT